MVDYKKWDAIVDSDDDEPRGGSGSGSGGNAGLQQRRKTPARGTPEYNDRMSHHSQSMAMIAEWLKEADPRMSSDEVTQMIKFITVQHRGVHPHNIMRHAEIVAHLEAAEAAGESPRMHSLIALCYLAKHRAEDADHEVAGRGKRVLVVAMGALNTLCACEHEGGAHRLFDALLGEPKSALQTKYTACEFAAECVANPPDDPRDAPPPEPSLWRKLGRAMMLQIGMSLAMMAVMYVAQHFMDRGALPSDASGLRQVSRLAEEAAAGVAHEAAAASASLLDPDEALEQEFS